MQRAELDWPFKPGARVCADHFRIGTVEECYPVWFIYEGQTWDVDVIWDNDPCRKALPLKSELLRELSPLEQLAHVA